MLEFILPAHKHSSNRVPASTSSFLFAPYLPILAVNHCRRKATVRFQLFQNIDGSVISFLQNFIKFTKLHRPVVLHWHRQIKTILGNFGLLQCVHTRNTANRRQFGVCVVTKSPYYARRLWISVMAGIFLAFEKGFHLFTRSHHPEIVSPKFLGELSSIFQKRYKVRRASCQRRK